MTCQVSRLSLLQGSCSCQLTKRRSGPTMSAASCLPSGSGMSASEGLHRLCCRRVALKACFAIRLQPTVRAHRFHFPAFGRSSSKNVNHQAWSDLLKWTWFVARKVIHVSKYPPLVTAFNGELRVCSAITHHSTLYLQTFPLIANPL